MIIGGLDSLAGTLLGRLLVGGLDSLVAAYVDPLPGSSVSQIVSFLMLIPALMVRPQGLFGSELIQRVQAAPGSNSLCFGIGLCYGAIASTLNDFSETQRVGGRADHEAACEQDLDDLQASVAVHRGQQDRL